MSTAHAPIHPGEVLLEEFLAPLGISQIGWRRRSTYRRGVSMRLCTESGRSARTRLCGCPGARTSDRFWMNLQNRYDLDVQFEAHRDELDKIKSLVA